MITDTPTATIELKMRWYLAALIFTLLITVFDVFAVVIPVLISGDFGAVWPARGKA